MWGMRFNSAKCNIMRMAMAFQQLPDKASTGYNLVKQGKLQTFVFIPQPQERSREACANCIHLTDSFFYGTHANYTTIDRLIVQRDRSMAHAIVTL